jgi:hypothetical protein
LTPADILMMSMENRQLRAQVTELQARMTEMVEARRDRRTLLADFSQAVLSSVTPRADETQDAAYVRLHLRLLSAAFFDVLDACLSDSTARPWAKTQVRNNIEYAIKNCPIKK